MRREINSASGSMRLLIVDDEPIERAALTRLCLSHGNFSDLGTASSGAEALEKIHANPPDVVLLECELNDMSGSSRSRQRRAPGIKA
jgi:CheY-like chemotaxis protein